MYTWEEIRRHALDDDKWLVIDGEVYDISSWAKRHPGGRKVISHYAGQDASVRLDLDLLNLASKKWMQQIFSPGGGGGGGHNEGNRYNFRGKVWFKMNFKKIL